MLTILSLYLSCATKMQCKVYFHPLGGHWAQLCPFESSFTLNVDWPKQERLAMWWRNGIGSFLLNVGMRYPNCEWSQSELMCKLHVTMDWSYLRWVDTPNQSQILSNIFPKFTNSFIWPRSSSQDMIIQHQLILPDLKALAWIDCNSFKIFTQVAGGPIEVEK